MTNENGPTSEKQRNEFYKSLEVLKSLSRSQAYHSGKGSEWEEAERLSEGMKRSIRESDNK